MGSMSHDTIREGHKLTQSSPAQSGKGSVCRLIPCQTLAFLVRTTAEGGVESGRWRSFIHPPARETTVVSPVSGGRVGGGGSSYRYVKCSDPWWWEFTLEEVSMGPQAPPLLAVLHPFVRC